MLKFPRKMIKIGCDGISEHLLKIKLCLSYDNYTGFLQKNVMLCFSEFL